MSSMYKRAARLVFVIGLVGGCGGDDDSSSGIVTGLPSQQKLSTLSDDDVKRACQSMNDGALMLITPAALQRATCLSLGIQAGLTINGTEAKVDVSKCQQAVDSCVNNASEVTEEDDCDSASAKDVAGCEATVGEYETCFNLFLNQLRDRLNQLTCQNAENLSSSGYSETAVDPSSIPQCQDFMTKCPEAELGLPEVE